jgi:hypothetical protein
MPTNKTNNKSQKSTSPSRSQLLIDKEVRLQKALESSPVDKELINRGRKLEREIQSNKAKAIEKTRTYEANKARGTQSSSTRKLIK